MKQDDGYVYFIHCIFERAVKIGWSINPSMRAREMETGSPHELVVVAAKRGKRSMEKKLHKIFQRENYRAEWFYLSDDLIQVLYRIRSDYPYTTNCESIISLLKREHNGENRSKRASKVQAISEAIGCAASCGDGRSGVHVAKRRCVLL